MLTLYNKMLIYKNISDELVKIYKAYFCRRLAIKYELHKNKLLASKIKVRFILLTPTLFLLVHILLPSLARK